MHRHIVPIGLLASIVFASPARSQSQNDLDFVLNNLTHVAYHEAAHALIDHFDLPVIGQEEDAADNFATLEILDAYGNAVEIVTDTSEAMLLYFERDEAENNLQFYGEHDLDIQRAYRVICIAHGTDPKRFENSTFWIGLPKERQESCEEDAERAWKGWEQLLGSIESENPNSGEPVVPTYEQKAEFDRQRNLIIKDGFLNDIGSYLGKTYDWEQRPKLTVKSCGEASAYYDSQSLEIVLCYELFDEFVELAKARQ